MTVNKNNNSEESLIRIVTELIRDWGLDLTKPISGRTRLVNDLDFASVDIIQLCVAIEQHYDRKIGFQDLLMKDGSYVSELCIAEVADYVSGKLNYEKPL
jgi:acyl carrier protein